jgi:peptidoglycan/LPS O-acetylase OafA/YrhL
MVAIIQFYLLFPFFRWLVLKLRKRAALTLTISLLLYIALMWFNTYMAPHLYEQTQLPWLKTLLAYRDRLFISWFFYFILGGYAGLWGRKLKILLRAVQKYNLYIFLISFAVVLYMVVNTGKINAAGIYQMNYLFTLPLTPAMVIYLVSSLLTFYYLSLTHLRKNEWLTNTLKTFGRYSYGCYFVHAMVLYYLNVYSSTYLAMVNPIALLLTMFIACSVISLVFCYLVSKIKVPVGNILVGRIS